LPAFSSLASVTRRYVLSEDPVWKEGEMVALLLLLLF
jgi:hypothetical protein